MRHECDTSVTQVRQERHEYNTKDTIMAQAKNFDFDYDTGENLFLYPYISYIPNGRLQGKEQFHSKNFLLEMLHSHTKMCLKSASQKINFVMAKAISKIYTLDYSSECSCTFSHSYIL